MNRLLRVVVCSISCITGLSSLMFAGQTASRYSKHVMNNVEQRFNQWDAYNKGFFEAASVTIGVGTTGILVAKKLQGPKKDEYGAVSHDLTENKNNQPQVVVKPYEMRKIKPMSELDAQSFEKGTQIGFKTATIAMNQYKGSAIKAIKDKK